MKRWILTIVVLALALAPLGAAPMLAQGSQTRLRAVNAVPDAPPLDVMVNNATAFSGVPFTGVTQYAAFPAGTTNVKFAPAGQAPVIDTTSDLLANTDYTVMAVGMMSSTTPLLLTDDNSPPASGQARVRFVHASPDAPPVNVLVGSSQMFSNVPFKGDGGYVSLTAGTTSLEIRRADDNSVIFSMPAATFNSCTVYTVFAMGLLNGQPKLQAVISTDAVTSCAPAATGVAATPSQAVTPAVRVITPTATGTLTPTATGTFTPTTTLTATPSMTPSRTPSGTPMTPSRTPSKAPSMTPSRTPSRAPTAAPSVTPTKVVATRTTAPASRTPAVQTATSPAMHTVVPTSVKATAHATMPPTGKAATSVPRETGVR